MKNKIKLSFIAVFVVLFALACGNSNQKTTTNLQTPNQSVISNPTSVDESPIAVKAEQLTRDYDENEIAADSKYKGRILFVSGKISNIAEVAGNLTVQLDGHKGNGINLISVMCTFPESEKASIGKLEKGQSVMLGGTSDGKTLEGYVGLKGCKIN